MDISIDLSADWLLEAANEEFSVVLRRLRELVGCSGYRLAELGGLDRPYLHRLEDGSKTNPSRQTVLKIGAGLIRSGGDVVTLDRLLLASGHLPIFLFAGVPILTGEKK